MLDQNRIKEAENNVKNYLEERMLIKTSNIKSKEMYIKNSDISIETAENLLELSNENYTPYLWIIVTSYYAMYYVANAILLNLGFKVGDKVSHKVTEDSLIVFVRNKLNKKLLEEYEKAKEEAIELTASKVDNIINSFEYEREKRSDFQYNMDNEAKRSKAVTSVERAKEFIFEMRKLL